MAVEDFTVTYPTPGPLGIIPGTCVSYPIQNTRRYDFTVTVTTSNVSWNVTTYKQAFVYNPQAGKVERVWQYVSDGYGGCLESAGVTCPEDSIRDQNYADVFVGQTGIPAGTAWKVEDLYITHY